MQDPRIKTLDLKVYGFNIRDINIYAPTNSESIFFINLFNPG